MEEIKKSFRKLAHTYHPDKNPNNEIVSSYFLEIQEAYAVLSNPLSRRVYDRERSRTGESSKKLLNINKKNLVEELIKIEVLLFSGPKFSVNKTLLSDYMDFLFSKSNISILLKENNTESDEFIINIMIRISSGMPLEFLENQYPNLKALAGENQNVLLQLNDHYRSMHRNHRFQKLLPLLIIILTILLCVAMYFYGNYS